MLHTRPSDNCAGCWKWHVQSLYTESSTESNIKSSSQRWILNWNELDILILGYTSTNIPKTMKDKDLHSHLWDTCACPCQYRHTWPLQIGHSWCWPVPQHSACHAEPQQIPSYWGQDAGQGSAHSCYQRSPRVSLAPIEGDKRLLVCFPMKNSNLIINTGCGETSTRGYWQNKWL